MYTAKDFGNTLIDTSILVLIAVTLARLQKKTDGKLDFNLKSIGYLCLSAIMVSALNNWHVLPLLKP